MAVYMPTISRAAIVPYFIAVDDKLLPFNDDTMPYISGGVIFVPSWIFREADVWSIAAEDLEWVRLYVGRSKYVDFLTGEGVTKDQNGSYLQWPAARRIGSRFYVPLQQVCDFFDLTPETTGISRDIIPQEQMQIIRIRSGGGVNGPTFVGLNKNAIRDAYNEYYAPPPTQPPVPTVSPGVTSPPSPTEEPPPVYNDVTIYISFYDISAGGTDVVWELLNVTAESDYRFCFFVSANDIYTDPGLIRRIYGSGHTIGIWLEKGAYDEYVKTSALLYEAAKISTVLVSADETTEGFLLSEDLHGLIFWEASQSLIYDDTLSVEDVTAMISKERGERQNLMSSCSVNAALMLSGILSYLREYEYTVESITETVIPVG